MHAKRLEIIIQGQVQGVGFRPYVYRMAKQLGLTGWVQNNAAGVFIEVQGGKTAEFIQLLRENIPPLAKVNSVSLKPIPLKPQELLFAIIASQQGQANTIIAPDTNTCSECRKELFDKQSRYFHYPFLNCTHCGPRFSITRELPYDRKQTSMSSFPLCQECENDYTNPENRRYHAQPTACTHCGPQLSLPVEQIAQYIVQGEIIALKSLGGYQLICDAQNKATLLKLRERKNRPTKPFALMVANSDIAKQIVVLNKQEQSVLESNERPIVLLKKKNDLLPYEIAPDLAHLGLMLPYTPLHYLLFNELHSRILVVTSANVGGDPIIIDDIEAQQKLQNIADKVISYNRHIITRSDDSVVKIINSAPLFVRRSRGFVPSPIQLPHAVPTTLAVGGHLKNTFCITRGNEAFVSQHIGSLTNKATIDFFHESLTHLLKFLNVQPERIAHDLHPDFYTTQFAQSQGLPSFAIQHHHAHLASVIAEHHLQTPVIGLALDGYGYGQNGEAWGGELLLLDNAFFERIGTFYPLRQPGGEIAAREPWRMAASVLHRLGRGREISKRFSFYAQAQTMESILDKKINCPETSSCGRLFDAASALLGIQPVAQYEGQAAMRLESWVTQLQILPMGWHIKNNQFDMSPTLEFLADLNDCITGANFFHGTLIAGLSTWIHQACRERKIDMVVLSGGCFLNQIVSEGLTKALSEFGITVFLPRNLPPNDGGISLGQAWIAGIVQG